MLISVLSTLFLFSVVAMVLVEAIGYFWHRFAEHLGWLGDTIRYRHWTHHEVDYPIDRLRPLARTYRSAGSWTWFALGGIVALLIFLLLPLAVALPISLGALGYSWGVISYLHSSFHVEGHWLERFAWFGQIRRLHDIHHWQPCNYGILFFWMDRVCGTLRRDFPPERQNIFPHYRATEI